MMGFNTLFNKYSVDDKLTIKHLKTIQRETGKKIEQKRIWPWPNKLVDQVVTFDVEYITTVRWDQDQRKYFLSEKKVVTPKGLNPKNSQLTTFHITANGNYEPFVDSEPYEQAISEAEAQDVSAPGEVTLRSEFTYLETILKHTQTTEEQQLRSYNTSLEFPKTWSAIPKQLSVLPKWLVRKILLDTYWIGYPISWIITSIANSENPHYTSYPSKQLGKTLRDLIFPGGSKKPLLVEENGAKTINLDAVFYAQIKAKKHFNAVYKQPFTDKALVFETLDDVSCPIRKEQFKLDAIYAKNNLVDTVSSKEVAHIIYFNGNSGSYQQDYKLAAEDALRFETEHPLFLLSCKTQAEFKRLLTEKSNTDLFVLFEEKYYYFDAKEKKYSEVSFDVEANSKDEARLISIKKRCKPTANSANQLDIEFLRAHARDVNNKLLKLPGKAVAITLFNYPGVLDSMSSNHLGKVEITDDLFESGRTMVEYLHKTKNVPYKNIILKGGSMGGGVSATVAAYYAKKGIYLGLEYATNPIGSTPDTGQLYLNKALGNNWFSTVISTICKPFIKLGTWGSEWTIDTGKAFYSLPKEHREYAVVRSPKAYRKARGSVDDAVLGLGLLGTFEKRWDRLTTKLGFKGHAASHQHAVNNRKRKMMTVDVTAEFNDITTGKIRYAPKECGHATATALYMTPDERWYNPNKLDANGKCKKKLGVDEQGNINGKTVNQKMVGSVHRCSNTKIKMVRESGVRFRSSVFKATSPKDNISESYTKLSAVL